MPIAWYIVPFKLQDLGEGMTGRVCAMDDYSIPIETLGGKWAATEVLGNMALVKVRTTAGMLVTLDSIFKRLPKDNLDDSLSDLSPVVKKEIRDIILSMGYSNQEIQAKIPNLNDYTLRVVLQFMATRRLKPSDSNNVPNGMVVKCKSIEIVDMQVQ